MRIAFKYSMAKMLILVSGMMLLLNVLGRNMIYDSLSLVPARIIYNYEFWRLVSFPFANTVFPDFLLFAFSLFIFGTSIERSITKRKFSLMLFSFVLFQGLLYSVIFLKDQISFSSVNGITFFLIALSIGVAPKEYVTIFSRYRVRFLGLTFILTSLFFTSTLVLTITDSTMIIFHNLLSSGLGLLSGFIAAYILTQVSRIRQEAQELSVQREENNFAYPPIEDFEHTISTKSTSKIRVKQPAAQFVHDDYETDEEHLNYILDKILETGEKSLSSHDREFLEEYSRRL